MTKSYSALLTTALFLWFQFTLFAQTTITITDDDLTGNNAYEWTNDNVYVLQGEVYLEAGGSLTINAGTVIRGRDEKAALIITRNARIQAEGNINQPIIFTDMEDELCDPNDLTIQDRGLWKGLYILGNAPHTDTTCLSAMPGLTPGERALYGAPDCAFNTIDNSGSLQYLSIRHSSVGLALGAVGRGTTIDHIEGFANTNGIVILGGNANLQYIASSYSAGNAFSWYNGWLGNGQFWFCIMGQDAVANGGNHNGINLPENGVTSNPTIYNATFIGGGPDNNLKNIALSYSSNSAGSYHNSIFTEFSYHGLTIQDHPSEPNGDDSYDQLLSGRLVLGNNFWWNCGAGNQIALAANGGFIGITSSNPDDPNALALIDHLNQNSNVAEDPEITNVSWTQDGSLDPRPQSDGPVFGDVPSPPNNDFFFEADHKGAFDATDLWLRTWTALETNGYLVPFPTDCDLSVSHEASEILCNGDSNGEINLFIDGGTPGYTIDWDNNAYDGLLNVTGLPGGTYSITVTGLQCCEVVEVVEIVEPEALNFSDCSSNTQIDENGSIFSVIGVNIVGGTPDYTVDYEGPNSGSITVSSSGVAVISDDLMEGDYSLTVTDANGCQDVCSTTVEPLCNLEVTATITPITCAGSNDGAINLNFLGGTPPLTFDWDDDDLDTIEDPVGLEPKTYTVTVTDENGCADTLSVTLVEPDPLVLDCSNVQRVSAVGAVDGSVTVVISGGNPGYFVTLTGPVEQSENTGDANTATFNQLPQGEYELAVTDANGCIQFCDVTIDGPPCELAFDSIAIVHPSCNGFTDGSITIALSGNENGPIIIDWDVNALDGQSTPSGLGGGIYSVTISDGLGCEIDSTITLIEPDELILSIEIALADRSEITNNGAIEASVFGGSPPYTLSWTLNDDPAGSLDIAEAGLVTVDGLSAGAYIFTLEDTKGCAVTLGDTASGGDGIFVDDVFIVEPKDTFIIELVDGITRAEADSIKAVIEAQNGYLARECNCKDSITRIQLWFAGNDAIDINTSSQGNKVPVKTDTSGIGKLDTLKIDTSILQNPDFCIAAPGNTAKSDTVRIAIIDSGVALTTPGNDKGHPLLTNMEWTNPLELANNKFDDDRNCLEDDVYGYDILNDSPLVIDKDGHGTHIAGIISDSFPNDIQLELMNLKIYEKGNGGVFDLICAIHYAINNGADIINLSLGYFNEMPSKTLFNALKRAEEQNTLVVISAGNDTLDLSLGRNANEYNRWPGNFKLYERDTTFFPLTNLIVVAALDSTEEVIDLEYSNHGEMHVDIATKGIFTSTYLHQGQRTLKGTSMSAAYVTRLAAIAKAKKPELDPAAIIKCMIESASPIKNPNMEYPSGKLAPVSTLECLGISQDSVVYEVPEFPEGRGAITYSSVQFKDALTITLGDGQTFYNDVTFTVTDGSNTLYTQYYCATNAVVWDGTNENGAVFPSGPYFIKLQVGTHSFSAQKVIKI